MPFSTPYPSFCSRSIEGTTTAGDTALRTKLQETWIYFTVAKMKEINNLSFPAHEGNENNLIGYKRMMFAVTEGDRPRSMFLDL